MDCGKVGKLIVSLRKEKGMTQKELGDAMYISDRTISKWERGIGCPDVSLLRVLSQILDVNIEQLLTGDLSPNEMNGGNMKKIQFYVCPACGNTLCATGDAEISCCGRKLVALCVQPQELLHEITVSQAENDYYVTLQHVMTKQHYISFAAYVTYDKMLFMKLYPEQAAEIRFPRTRGGQLYVYCTEHGLFCKRM